MSENWRGDPKITKQKELWRFLKLANATKNDVFCDLGCGYGNLCRWAIQKVNSAIGTEDHKKRCRRALHDTRRFKNITILNEDYRYEKTLRKLRKCTIFYCTNGESLGFYYKLQKTLHHKAYFVTYTPPPYPIKPENYDGLYYLVRIPFELAKSQYEWKNAIAKKGSMNEYKRRFLKDFDDDHEEYKERLLMLNEDIIGIDWVKKRKLD
jgi:hypothetical protein